MEKRVEPQMLILARESRGMSQADLALAIHATQGKISKYENEMLEVSEEDLASIADVLGYTHEFFFQKDKIYGLGSTFLFHRQRKSAPMSVQRKVQAQINILRMQVERLFRGAELETEVEFCSFDIDAHNGNFEKIAALVRASWRIPLTGPVPNVTASIESAGGIVLKCSFETSLIDAAHLWLPDLPPLFFVNRNLSGDRLRWTLAHEIGHAVMHRNPTGDIEDQANGFASEFLMPKKDITKHLYGLTLEKAVALKAHWKVSMAAIIKRARDLGCVTERQYRGLFTRLSAQGYRTNEPFPIGVEEPQAVRQLVVVHMNELGYDEFELAKLLFSADPQFFGPQQSPAILRIDNRPFFAFYAKSRPGPKRSSI